jgi:uncharacterized protein
VRVGAAAERGRANDALIALLADALGVAKERVRVVSGHSSRRKLVEVERLGDDEARRRLESGARG